MDNLRHFLLATCLLLGSFAATAQNPWSCGTGTRISLVNTTATEVLSCAEDGIPSFLTFRSSSFGLPYVILVTDDQGVIQLVSYRLRIDFDQFKVGNYRVYILSFLGNLVAKPGMNIFTDQLGVVCYGLSANYISVRNFLPDAGSVAFAGGGVSRLVCSGDGRPDVLSFETSSTDPGYRYILTDGDNVILEILSGNTFNFDGMDGVRRVWGVSLVGAVLAQPGQTITSAVLSEDCFDVSANFLEIIPTQPDGGTVAFEGLGTSIRQCSNDDRNAQFQLTYSSSSPASYAFILTDTSNVILQVLSNGRLDARNLPAGMYRIWGVSYLGMLRAATGQNAAEEALSDDCFELSTNFASLEVYDFEAGGISSGPSNAAAVVICLNENKGEQVSFNFPVATTPGFQYALVVTNPGGGILHIQAAGAPVNFAPFAGLQFTVSGVAYQGNLLIKAGDVFGMENLADGCFARSTNGVSVTKKNPDGGRLSFEDGSTSKEFCYSPRLNPGIFQLQTTGKGGENYLFLLTDASRKILTISADGQFDLLNFPSGTYRIYGLAYTGALSFPSGANINETNFSNECADLSDNFVTIIKTNIEGATVSLQDGRTEALLCTDGRGAVEVTFSNTSRVSQQYAYLLTDLNNQVIRVLSGDRLSLSAQEDGDYRVWGLAFSGNLLTKPGDDAAQVVHSTQCYELSQNFVRLRRRNNDGGALTAANGSSTVLGCLGSGSPILVQALFSREPVGTGSAFLLTNAQNTILAIQSNGFFSLSGFEPGTYRIWHVAYSGNLLAAVQQNAGAVPLSDECFDLSDNFIAITLENVQGGSVSLSDQSTERRICLGQGSGFLSFINNSSSTATYRYVLTNANDQVILVLIGASVDISVAPPGEYRIYGISYTGNLLLSNTANIRTSPISDRCYALSSNFVTIRNERVLGGTIAFAGGSSSDLRNLCPEAGNPAVLNFQRAASQGASYAYLITDDLGVLTGISTTSSFDFSSLPEGEYRIWGLAYAGTLLAMPGINPATSPLVDGCFSLSVNTLRVRRTTPVGGQVSLPGGATDISTCTDSPQPQQVRIEVSGVMGAQSTFLLTDTSLTILQVSSSGVFSLDTLPEGEYRAWALAYSGTLLAAPGLQAATDELAECFGLSANYVAIYHTKPMAGMVAFNLLGVDTASVPCAGGSTDGVMVLSSLTESRTPYVFLVTDTLNRLLFSAPVLDAPIRVSDSLLRNEVRVSLSRFPGGDTRIWGLAYTGNLQLSLGMPIDSAVFSEDCFDLSSGSIPNFLAKVDGGLVEAIGFDTDTVYVCSGDQVADSIFFATSSQGVSAGYRYVLTNTSNIILAELTGDVQNFEALPFNELRIWGVSFTGEYISNRNRNVTTSVFSAGCFELSENYITIIRDRPVGGTISTVDNRQSVYFCPGRDGFSLGVRTTSRSRSGYVYVLTNASGVVVGLHHSSVIPLRDRPIGQYRVYGLSYAGRLLVKPGDTIGVTTPLASSCFELASNFISLTRGGEVDGQRISTLLGQTVFYTCPGDGVGDLVIVFQPTPIVPGSNYTLVITDEDNRIRFPNVQNLLIDFDGAEPGTYRIWGLSYTGTLMTQFGALLQDGMLSSDCFDLSENFITVVSQVPVGGAIQTSEGLTTVNLAGNDGVSDLVRFINTGASPKTPYRYLLTTTENVILQIASDDFFDFEGVPFGEYRVWGLAYTGSFLAAPGANAATAPLSDNCFSLSSNFVTVNILPAASPSRAIATALDIQGSGRVDLKLSAAPNPTTGSLLTRFYVPDTPVGEARMQLLSMAGSVMLVKEMQVTQGMNELSVQLDGMQAGMYLLRMQYRDRQETIKIIKLD